jgi:predicted membrane-bound spermidine synthase
MLAILGTRGTFIAYSLALLSFAIVGIALERESLRALRYALLIVLVLLLVIFVPGGMVKAVPGLVYETESFYNYIQVVDDGSWRLLTVNEGQAYQSAYRSDRVLTGGIWDLFLIAPSFASTESPKNALLIGLAAGTVARGYTQVHGAIQIDGVELDPAIIAVGQRYFAMNEPNLRVVSADGRDFLERRAGTYDVVASTLTASLTSLPPDHNRILSSGARASYIARCRRSERRAHA